MTTSESHVHLRPGGAVHATACGCLDPASWPPRFDAVSGAATPAADVATASGRPRRGPQAHFRALSAPLAGMLAAARALLAAVLGRSRRRGARAARVGWRALAAGTRGLLVRLEYLSVVAGVAVATWAAWEVDAVAGKAVLAAGLLFMGGALGRLVRELRGGR